jgi:peptidoglycan hydrolase CwlO-like protein
MIIDDRNLVATVQRHEENIKSNQHRIAKVEQDLESKTNRLEEKLDKLNGKVWLILILVAATSGQSIWSMLMAVAK